MAVEWGYVFRRLSLQKLVANGYANWERRSGIRVTSLVWFAWNFTGFKTEGPMF